MTHWKVGNYDFDADSRRLRRGDRDLLLEPKTAALLAYFCQHPGRDIGRDELLSAVWYGQVVSDNSINRVIVLLRKALQDDEKSRKYIATIPKLGYRLIADVTAIEHSAATAGTPADRSGPSSSLLAGLSIGLGLLGLSLIYFFARSEPPPPAPQGQSIVPLSRLAVSQFNADLASDGQTLLYTASDGDWNQIYQASGGGVESLPVSAPNGHADFATWAHGDAFAVYQYSDGERCEFHRIERAQFAARSAEVLYQCVPGSYSELSLSLDNSTLYFVERATVFAPYAVYALDLERGSKRRLSQPVAQGYGNHYVDVHPQSGALLLLSNHAPGKTSVYELDPSTDSFALRQTFDYSLDSAIWSHRDQSVVHPSKHPSYQLLETSLITGVSRSIVSDSRRISSPRRIHSPDAVARDYLFTSYLFNRDIEIAQFPTARFNSAVMDYLPAISNSSDQLAFVSKRSGDSQIWIKNFRDESLTAIEPPDSGRRFYDLVWSTDDRHLLANTNTGILVYSLGDNAFVHDISLTLPAYAVQWHDAQTLSFSHYLDQRWRAYHYRIRTGETVALDERWAFSSRNDHQQLFLDQSLTPFRGGLELTALRDCVQPVWRYQLRYQLDQGSIYCHARDVSTDLLHFDANLNMTRLQDIVERYEFFSVRDGFIAKTTAASAHSDIMRTRRPD